MVADQPVAGGGEDQGPTPTELFVASLASCVAFYVGRFLRRHPEAGDEFAVECEFEMSDFPPARVAAIALRVVLAADLGETLRAAVLRAAEHCTVHNSLIEPPSVTIEVVPPVLRAEAEVLSTLRA